MARLPAWFCGCCWATLVVLLVAAPARAGPFVPHVVSPAPALPSHLQLADLDNDGDQDILVAVDQGVVWFENQGAGSYSSAYDVATGLGDLSGERLKVISAPALAGAALPYLAAASSVPGEPVYAVVVSAAPGDDYNNRTADLLRFSPRKIPLPTNAVALAAMPVTIPGLLPGVVAVQSTVVQLFAPTDNATAARQPSGDFVVLLIDTGATGVSYERALVGRFTDSPSATCFDTDILLMSSTSAYLLRRQAYTEAQPLTWTRQASALFGGLRNIDAAAASDLDGDSLLDLVVFTRADGLLQYLRNDFAATAGFASPVQIGNAHDLADCDEVALVDIDGDSKTDIVALSAEFGAGGVYVYINSGTVTAPSWSSAPVALPLPPTSLLYPYSNLAPTGLAVGDVDGDLDVDIVVSSAQLSNVFLYENDGSGSFTLKASLNVMNTLAPIVLRAFHATADHTQPVDMLAVASGSVLMHAINALETRHVFEIKGGQEVAGADATARSLGPYYTDAKDVDNDGDDDVLVTGYVDGLGLLLRNDGTGAMAYDAATSVVVESGGAPGTVHADLVDLDGDGYRDIFVAANPGAFWVRNRGTEAPGQFEGAGTPAGRRWLYGPSSTPSVFNDKTIGGSTWADFDGDGRMDVAISTFIGSIVMVIYQSRAPAPAGQFETTAPLLLGSYNAAAFCSLSAGDLNSDGYADIAYVAGAAAGVLLNGASADADAGAASSQRNFSLPSIALGTSAATSQSIKITDLDGDSRNDLLLGSNSAGDLLWLPGNGLASFGSPVSLASTGLQGSVWQDVIDLDGDGDLDILSSYSTVGATRWLEQQSATIDVAFDGDLASGANRVPLNGQTSFSLLVTNRGPDAAYGVTLSTIFGAGLGAVSWTCTATGTGGLQQGYATQSRCLASSGQNVLDGLVVDLPAGTTVNVSFSGHISRSGGASTAAAFTGSEDDTVTITLTIGLGDAVLATPSGKSIATTTLLVDTCPRDAKKNTPGVCGCGRADRRDVSGNVQCDAFVGSGGFVALLVVVPLLLVCCVMLALLLVAATALCVVQMRSRRQNNRKILTPPPYARLAYDLSNVDMQSIDDYLRGLGPFLDVAALMEAFDALLLDGTFFAALIAALPPLQRAAKRASTTAKLSAAAGTPVGAGIAADLASNASTPRGNDSGGGGGGEVARPQLATALVYCYHAHDQADMLLRMLLRVEPKSVLAEFREDDMFSTMYRTYTKIVALRWLWNALALPLNELTERVLEDVHGKHYSTATASIPSSASTSQKFGAKSLSSSSGGGGGGGGGTNDHSQELNDDGDDDDDDDVLDSRDTSDLGIQSPRSRRRTVSANQLDRPVPRAETSTSTSRRSESRSAASHLTQLNIHVAVQTMLMRITSSAEAFPDELRMVMQACRKTALSSGGGGIGVVSSVAVAAAAAAAATGQQQQLLIGPLVGLLFNRLICPAIVQPRQYGLIGVDEHLNAEQKRALASAAKLLLTYATGTGAAAEFGSAPIAGDQLMFTNHMRVREFLDAISGDSYASDVDASTATRTTASAWAVDSTAGGVAGNAVATRKRLLLGAQESLDLRTEPPAGRVPPGVRLDALKIVYVHCARTKSKLIRAIRHETAKQQQTAARDAPPAANGRKHKHDLATRFKRLVDVKYLAATAEKHKKKKKRRRRNQTSSSLSSSASFSLETTTTATTTGGQTEEGAATEGAQGTSAAAARRRPADIEMTALSAHLGDDSASNDDDDDDNDDGGNESFTSEDEE